jgi:hypothetical protein
VAVAAGNQITILQKDDDYMEPCGTFTGKIHLIHLVMLVISWCQLSHCIIF